ncbi:MAG: sigma-70 family RNA polymerase sigma factor [Oscillospiraceae bacterium]|nr:sigma-70 family RNA polymerase sigma factor [Oscillospiraceae bacterium]
MTDNEFAEFYKRNYMTVYRICYIFMKDHAEAEDCTEDTFVKVLTGSFTFENERHERAWLSVAAANLCKDRLKNWWHSKTSPIEDYEKELKTEENDQYGELTGEVMKLPDKLKEVVFLYYYIGYQTDEIATLLKRPASTIRNQMRDARKRLKKALGGEL